MSRPHEAEVPRPLQLPDIKLKKPLAIRELPAISARRPSADRRDVRAREALLRRVHGEFNEMPGLRITLPQARRLFALRADVCVRILDTLADAGLLVRTADERYARRDILP